MLREIPHCHVKADDSMFSLGSGWKEAENMLKVEFAKVLKPQLPRANLLAELDADIVMKEWFSTFDEYFAEDEDEEEGDSGSEDDEDDEVSESSRDEDDQDEIASDSGSERDEDDMPSASANNPSGDEAPSEFDM
jgi:hypothetical protein